jgi:glycyl-tRNA synthetase
LRPETAQGILLILNVQKIRKNESSFGIQTGKRLEMKLLLDNLFFVCVNLNKWKCNFLCVQRKMKHYEFWKEARLKWHPGLGKENYRFHDHEKLAHYANAAADIEFNFRQELEGIHQK